MNTSNTSIPVQIGMREDLHDFSESSNNYLHALNGSVEDFSGEGNFIQNTHSNYLAVTFPSNLVVIGHKEIPEQSRTIYMMINTTTGLGQIGEVLNCEFVDRTDFTNKNPSFCNPTYNQEITPLEAVIQKPYCQYYTIIEDAFNFDIDHPVDIEYRITDCDLRIYFTDFKNQRRYIYFDYVNDDPKGHLQIQSKFFQITGYDNNCSQPIYASNLDFNKLAYHPAYQKICINFVDLANGGNIKAGVYQFITAYSDISGNPLSQYSPSSNIIPVKTRNVTIDTIYDSGKSIVIDVTNIDTQVFQYFNLVVAETLDNFTTFKLIGTYPTNIDHIRLTYSGNESGIINLSASDVLFRRPFYETAKSITKSNNYLFFSDLTSFSKPNIQQCADKIKLYWETVAIPESVYRDPINVFKYRTYQRDEVYAFALAVEWAWGEEQIIHIPGRLPLTTELSGVYNNGDVVNDASCDNSFKNEYWQVYNTASIIQAPHKFNPERCTSKDTWEWGEFAYWQSTEKYPNNPDIWGALCGQNVRYHKFPDSNISHIHDGKGANKQFPENNIVFPIGVRVDNNTVNYAFDWCVQQGIITQTQRNLIKGYRLIRGNRVGNKSIIAKGLLYDVWQYSKFNNKYYYPNYPYNDLRPDNFISNDVNTYQGSNTSSPLPISFVKSDRYTFHSPDTHFVNPNVNGILKLETEEYGFSEGWFSECDLQAKHKILSTVSVTLAFATGCARAFSKERDIREKVVTQESRMSGYVQPVAFGAGVPIPLPVLPTVGGGLLDPITATQFNIWNHFNKDTGSALIPTPGVLNPFAGQSSVKTYQGTTYQLLGAGFLSSGNPIMGVINLASGFFGQFSYLFIQAMQEADLVMKLIETLVPYKNYHIQYNSVGKYNNFNTVPNLGFKQRLIKASTYLTPQLQAVNNDFVINSNDATTSLINNYSRESSVYIQTTGTSLKSTVAIDASRVRMDDFGFKAGNNDLGKKVYAPISSYYASIKNNVPNQYGSVLKIQYVETDGCSKPLVGGTPTNRVFGGDTFINRFALKRKMPFFLQSRFKFINGADVKYSSLSNVGYSNFYFDTAEPFGDRVSQLNLDFNPSTWGNAFERIIGVDKSRMDGKTAKLFYQNGYIHLYNYGIPYFLVESDFNVDYRHAENSLEKAYYPMQSDLDFWLQEKNVPITEDNYFFYNKSYSKQNKESVLIVDQITKQDKQCKINHHNLLIYSDQPSQINTAIDNWLIFKANNQYNFPLTDGRLVSIDGIESDKVLVRLENASKIFGAYNIIQADVENIQVGTGGIFQSRPKEFAVTDLGYAGSQHIGIVKTEFGHIWADARRGQVFNLNSGAGGMDELSNNGMKNWFKQNLPFQVLKDFPNMGTYDIDNNFKGIGLHMCFDKRFNRFFITKLDYKLLDKTVQYNNTTKTFFKIINGDPVNITLGDSKYFGNKSWTISYNFYTKSWISFHSFKPNFYLSYFRNFQSGIQTNTGNCSVWSHGVSNKSYQVYYGNLYPFTISYISKQDVNNNIVNAIQFGSDSVRYQNEVDHFYSRLITFNKAVVYNDRQCSGLLEFIVREPNNLFQHLDFPKQFTDETQILLTNSENLWNFNHIKDLVLSQTNNVPIWKNTYANDDMVLNQDAFNYLKPDLDKSFIRGRQAKVRLINDKYSNFKIVFLFSNFDTTNSIR